MNARKFHREELNQNDWAPENILLNFSLLQNFLSSSIRSGTLKIIDAPGRDHLFSDGTYRPAITSIIRRDI